MELDEVAEYVSQFDEYVAQQKKDQQEAERATKAAVAKANRRR